MKNKNILKTLSEIGNDWKGVITSYTHIHVRNTALFEIVGLYIETQIVPARHYADPYGLQDTSSGLSVEGQYQIIVNDVKEKYHQLLTCELLEPTNKCVSALTGTEYWKFDDGSIIPCEGIYFREITKDSLVSIFNEEFYNLYSSMREYK